MDIYWNIFTMHGPMNVKLANNISKRQMEFNSAFKGLIRSNNYVCFLSDSPQLARASSFTRFLDHTQRRNTVGRTPLDEWSAHRRDLYLKTHTKLTTDKSLCLRWDSNSQSQQASNRRPTPHTAWPLEPAVIVVWWCKIEWECCKYLFPESVMGFLQECKH
jgi:hypothetical protein